MFRMILVAVDGSDASSRALAEALDLARAMNAGVHVAHVIQAGAYPPLILGETEVPDLAQQAVSDMLERDAETILARAQEAAGDAGIPVTVHKRWGHPGSEIVGLAQELGADLVVIGSGGRSRIDRLFLGSVSSFVIEHGTAATLVVRA